MRFHVLATDYDGTLAHEGIIAEPAREGLKKLRKSGRKAILVTGRNLDELRSLLPDIDLFDSVVAENGAVLFDPATQRFTDLAAPPPQAFTDALRAKNVTPLDVGRVIVATWQPHEHTVLETIREFGLDLTVIFNKGAVMVLPANINKATGLAAQLEKFGLSFHNVVGIGDAENDLAFLARCEAAVAVANALPSVQSRCDVVTAGERGEGVAELVDWILRDDLHSLRVLQERRTIALGTTSDGQPYAIPAACTGVLLAGTSGGGKSTLVAGFIERLAAAAYQYCVIDPEGDYAALEDVVRIGDATTPPQLEAVRDVLSGGGSAVVSLLAIAVDDRVAFAQSLFSYVTELRATHGRPHWVIVDEAHHFLPQAAAPGVSPGELGSVFYITTRPELVAERELRELDVVIAIGEDPRATIASARQLIGCPEPAADVASERVDTGHAVVWTRADAGHAYAVATLPGKVEQRRHVRKYAQGELAQEKSFYFQGPERRLNLRAQNLLVFMQLADGVDDETWTYHRDRNEYSTWVREAIGDGELAGALRDVEGDASLGPRQSRARVAEAIRQRYTAPA